MFQSQLRSKRFEIAQYGVCVHIILQLNLLDAEICRGENVFQAFTTYLKSKNANDQSKEGLLKELSALNEHLKTKVHRLVDMFELG